MKSSSFHGLIAGLLITLASCGPAKAQTATIDAESWSAYKAKFLDASGRIIDDGNGNVSHSEGQGYGLLLAYLAGSPADFEQIWYFTRTELLLRDDGLAVWRWDPAATPHVTDTNNASDGDILIAYALARAGAAWNRSDYLEVASKIAQALLSEAVVERNGLTLLLPGVSGFSAKDRSDGPIINPSYWIFEAFPLLETLAPSEKWRKLTEDGTGLLRRMKFGPRQLPSDWVSVKTMPKPAEGFAADFGYNALRIPLYLLRGGIEDKDLLRRLQQGMTAAEGTLATIDVETGAPKEALTDPGYEIINHAVACVVDGRRLPASAKRFEPTLYYPSTLHLLGLSYVVEKHPECL